jgi:hypothetical protein
LSEPSSEPGREFAVLLVRVVPGDRSIGDQCGLNVARAMGGIRNGITRVEIAAASAVKAGVDLDLQTPIRSGGPTFSAASGFGELILLTSFAYRMARAA